MVTAMTDLDSRITRHFVWREAACRETGELPEDTANIEKVAAALEGIRASLRKPIVVSSWYRSPRHSIEARKDTPGVHTTGLAVDVACRGEDALKVVYLGLDNGFEGIGVSQRGGERFIHLDMVKGTSSRPRPTIWSY